MADTRNTQFNLRQRLFGYWQHPLLVPILIALLVCIGYGATRYHHVSDQTHNHRNTLSSASQSVLRKMPAPILITAYCSNSPYKGRYFRKSISALIQRYQHAHAHIDLHFQDPFASPSQARQIQKEGEIIVEYGGRQEKLYLPYTEERLTNLLLKLSHGAYAPIVVAQAQRETASTDMRGLRSAIQSAGLHLDEHLQLQASADGQRPVLVVPSSVVYSASQTRHIMQHLDRGGSMLWVTGAPEQQGLQAVAERFGIQISDGVILEPGNRQFGIDAHDISSQRYSGLGPGMDFALRTFFLEAHAITRVRALPTAWKVMPMIASSDQSWLSASRPSAGQISDYRLQLDKAGPLSIAMGFERVLASGEFQRIMMIASPGFLSETQQQRGGNQAWTMRSLQWLVHHQPGVDLPPSPLRDTIVDLPQTPQARWWLLCLFNGFQFGLPLILLLCSGWAWYRRRQQ